MFAYIPARGGSKRIPRKNTFPIFGKPMILHVVDHLLGVDQLSGIAISTDDDEIIQLVSNYSAKIHVLTKRSPELSSDNSTFMDLVNYDIDRYAALFSDTDVLFTLPTSILVTSQYYKKALDAFKTHSQGLLMSVTPNDQSPFLSFVEGDEGIMPLFPEKFILPTMDLAQTYLDCGCFYVFNLKRMKGLQKFLDLKPITPIILPGNVGIDIDSASDIEKLNQILGKS